MPFRGDRLGWAQLAQREREADQQKWERSPGYLDQILRVRQGVKNVQQGLEQRDPSGTFARERAEEIRMKAAKDASEFELRYTAKDKADISKLKNQRRAAKRMLGEGLITQSEYEMTDKRLLSKELGYVPGELPSLSPYPKGQEIGASYKNAAGMWVRRNKDGEEIPIDFGKTEAGIAQEHELKAATKKAEIDAAERKAKQDRIADMAAKGYTDPTTKQTRPYKPQEIRDVLELAYPSTPAPDPGEVKHAQEYIDMMESRWGTKPPPEVLESIKRAGALIEAANKRIY